MIMRGRKATNIYYLYHNDKFIDVGTIEEISKRQHIKKESLYCYIVKSKKSENTNMYIRLLEKGE